VTTPAAAAAERRVALNKDWLGPALTCLGVVLLAIVPMLTQRGDVINLLFLVFLNLALSQSWNILGGFAGQINLGHAAFFGVGALVARSLWIGGAPYPLAFVAAGVAALAFAMLIGVPTFRLRGVYFAIGTLGITEVLRITTGNVLPGLSAMPPNYVSNYDLTLRYELALGLAAACLLAAWLFLRSRVGLGVLAVREDEEAAQATGVGALKHKLIALALSSLFAGLAGGVFAFYHVSYYPQFPFDPTWTFDAVLPVFVGGVGTLFGPILGGLLYVVVRERLAVSLTQAHQVIFGILFIIVVLALPGGLIDVWSRVRRRSPKGQRGRT
jgi:branched-chain amino acid transport system permease protein